MIDILEKLHLEYQEERRIMNTASSMILRTQASDRAQKLAKKYRTFSGDRSIDEHGRKTA